MGSRLEENSFRLIHRSASWSRGLAPAQIRGFRNIFQNIFIGLRLFGVLCYGVLAVTRAYVIWPPGKKFKNRILFEANAVRFW